MLLWSLQTKFESMREKNQTSKFQTDIRQLTIN